MKFDWHTEEDGPFASEEPTAAPTSNASRRLLIGLSVTAVILVATFAVYYQLNRRVDEAQAQIELDVLAAFNLAQQALAQGDAELLATVLSRRDPQWFREWQEVAESSPYPHIISPLLTLQAEPEIVSVTLSNELNEAEIVWRRSYSFRSDNGLTETIQLERTDFYYKTLNGWLWARPPDDFWGGWETWHGRYLTLVYPVRDAATAVPLAEALEAHLDSWCQGELPVFMRCPYQPPWEMRLAVNPGALVRLSQFDISRPASGGNWRFSPLPAPSIIGRPVDEAGQEALLHYYALQTGLILVRYNQQRPAQNPSPNSWMQAVLWLDEAGLYPWPPPDLPPAPAALPGDLALHCPTLSGGGLWQYATASGEWRPLLPEVNVHEFFAWPGGDGFLIGSRQMHKEETWVELSRYRDGRLIPIRSFLGVGLEGPAAGLQSERGDGRYLTLYTYNPSGLWDRYRLDSEQCDQNGCPLTPLDSENWWENWSPDGRHALRIVSEQRGPNAFRLSLWLTDNAGDLLREIGFGYTDSAWLSHDRFIYAEITFGDGATPQATYRLHLSRVDQDEPEVTITAEEMFAAHGLDIVDKWLAFGGFLVNPYQPDQIIVLANQSRLNGAPNMIYSSIPPVLLETEQATGEIKTRLLPSAVTELIAAPTLSRDGRYLILIGREGMKTVVEMIDLQGESAERIVIAEQPNFFVGLFTIFGLNQPTWSPDGRWLAMMDEGVVHLIEVETANHAVLIPPQPGCAHLAWI